MRADLAESPQMGIDVQLCGDWSFLMIALETKPSPTADAVEPLTRELLFSWPDMLATVIGEWIGRTRSVRVLRSRVADLRRAGSVLG